MPASQERDPGSAARPTTFREVERKVRVPDDFALPPLATVVNGVARAVVGTPVTLVATYLDTPDLRLLRWGVSLRRREGGADGGWHLKLPVSDGGKSLVRDEVTLPLAAGPPGNVPPELADLVTALVRDARLDVVATIRTSRVPTVLLDADGVPRAEVVEDDVVVERPGGVAVTFREVEVEARGDAKAAAPVLASVAALLVAHGGVPEAGSKVGYALAPHGVDPADVVVPSEPRAQDPAGATLQWVLASGVRAFLLADIAVRRQQPDAVHGLRVAARTLRSALRTFGPVLDAAWAQPLRAELAWAAGEMGTARDTEVFLARLESLAAHLPEDDRAHAVQLIDAAVRDRLDAAREASLVTLRSDRYRHLLVALVDATRAPGYAGRADEPAVSVLPGLVDRATRRLAKAVRRLTVSSPSTEWHRVRVLAKRARYLAEATAPVLGRPARRQGAALEQVTELLGGWHDSFVAREMLREMASRPGVDGRTGYVLGLLDAVEADREAEQKAAFPGLWRRVVRVLRRNPLQ